MKPATFDQFAETFRRTIERLYARSGAARWNLRPGDFAQALYRSWLHRFGPDQSEDAATVALFLESLHVQDLALAAACAAGNNLAWEHLVSAYRSAVGKFARAAIGDPSHADEIADSLWADLYGLKGSRAADSPLSSYHGRSPLAAWLRVVVARRETDMWRATRRNLQLDGDAGSNGAANRAIDSDAPSLSDPDRNRLLPIVSEALNAALAELAPNDKLRLSYYYVHELTLAQIAALIGEHESTVSRNLARSRVEIRRAVERALRRTYSLSDDQVKRCFEYAVGDWPFDLRRALAQLK